MLTGTEPIEDGELLYRRVSLHANPPEFDAEVWTPSPQAFRPNRRDADGLSVFRAKYISPQLLAQRGSAGKQYCILELHADCLRGLRIEIQPDPEADDPGHALLTNLNAANRRSDAVQELMLRIVRMCVKELHGPWTGQKPAPRRVP